MFCRTRTEVDILAETMNGRGYRAEALHGGMDQAQRDRVIASYALLSAIGRVDVQTLGLPTPNYAPEVHYHQVRDAWGGVRTPDGR